ncbi:hypothetical protein AMK59_7013 [Oryctes borbonicus]|uniref:TGF-beta family profile domain-containing protein n=1 Tax=Oryctes borbonicus TaxID=1629725 RepID=A0A0T6ATI5_9SCAR|nr:hypothetical protein AMK59_7013 [Oryctes borbonicus]
MYRCTGITVLLLFVCLSDSQSNSDPFSAAAFLKQTPQTACTGCSQKITLIEDEQSNTIQEIDQRSFSDNVLTTLRIEYIKNQILKKLRLKEKPAVSVDDLPQIIKENDYIMSKIRDDGSDDGYSDDFYARTTRAVIFPYEDEARCLKRLRYASACLPFQLPSDIYASDVSSAELWFYKLPDAYDSRNQTIVVSEVAHWDSDISFQKTKPIAIKETSLIEGWVKINVGYVIKNWLQYQDSPIHALNVVCKTCYMDAYNSPISFGKATKPFLIIYTHTQNRVERGHRRKRNVNCEPGNNECCRESLYISFADIGWSDWIIHPPGYNAYFCKGSCATAASLTLTGSQHNFVIQKIMFGNKRKKAAKLELKPCCAPTRYRNLQLLYMNNNKTLTTKILTNMIVESCGCM